MSIQHISQQQRAFEAALTIAGKHPKLPAAYTTVHTAGTRIDFQLGSLADWEAWREALATKGEDAFNLGTGDLLLTFDTVVGGYEVHVYVIDQVRSALPVKTAEQEPARFVPREDPHESPLHHDYATPRDFPSLFEQRNQRPV